MSKVLVNKMFKDENLRKEIIKESHLWFFNFYFSHYVKYETASFQKEMFHLSEESNAGPLIIQAFRNSGKSTIFATSLPIWSILGKKNKKLVLIVSKNQSQARKLMNNLKIELETNDLLKKDLGPFEEKDEEWKASSIVIPKYGAKITVASLEESIRGMRYKENRPDLIIIDDPEDLASTKKKENGDKLQEWFFGEIVPLGQENTDIIILGTLSHENSLLMRLKKKINNKEMKGIFKRYPLMDEDGTILWPGKFPNKRALENYKKIIGDEVAWHREYLLETLPDNFRVITRESIQYYEDLPGLDEKDYRFTWIGVDPAASEKDKASSTGIVLAQVHGRRKNLKIYILPNLVNIKMSFPKTVKMLKEIMDSISGTKKAFIEGQALQPWLTEQLRSEGYNAESVPVYGDKRSRLAGIAIPIQNATILFPRTGAEELIDQLVNFNSKRNNDLADAFSLLIGEIFKENNKPEPRITVIDAD